MKINNNKPSKCVIRDAFPTFEILKQKIFIDLEKQEVINLSTGKILKQRVIDTGYVVINFFSNGRFRNFKLHRLFFYWQNGYLPRLVDHKDRNKLNNNINNLRELTHSENARNTNKSSKRQSRSKYKGVTKTASNKYIAKIRGLNGKTIHIGTFYNEDDAGQAYNDKLRELGLEEVSVLNDTPQERARKNIQFEPLPQEMNHIKDLFLNIEPLVDFK